MTAQEIMEQASAGIAELVDKTWEPDCWHAYGMSTDLYRHASHGMADITWDYTPWDGSIYWMEPGFHPNFDLEVEGCFDGLPESSKQGAKYDGWQQVTTFVFYRWDGEDGTTPYDDDVDANWRRLGSYTFAVSEEDMLEEKEQG